MIVKIKMPVNGLRPYTRANGIVYAKRMKENFIIETGVGDGWQQGHAGDWLLKIENRFWAIISDEVFNLTYKPMSKRSKKARS